MSLATGEGQFHMATIHTHDRRAEIVYDVNGPESQTAPAAPHDRPANDRERRDQALGVVRSRAIHEPLPLPADTEPGGPFPGDPPVDACRAPRRVPV